MVELSALLQRLPIYPVHLRAANFRSPDAVSRKTTDLATAHPDYQRTQTRGSRLDRKVIAGFIDRPGEMHALAVAIREASAAGDLGDLGDLAPASGVDEDAAVEEGGLLLRRHLQRERRSGIRAKKVAHVLAQGLALECQVCGFDFARTYGPRGDGYIECHHIVPLHVTGVRTTRLADLILICANCHRMIHRGSPWLTPDQLRESLTHQSQPVPLQ